MKILHSVPDKTDSTSFIYEIGSTEVNSFISEKQNILNNAKLEQQVLQKDIEGKKTEVFKEGTLNFQYKNKTSNEITFNLVKNNAGEDFVSIVINGVETKRYLNNATKKIVFKETDDPQKIEGVWVDWKDKGGEKGSFIIEIERHLDLQARIAVVNNLLNKREYQNTLLRVKDKPTQLCVYHSGVKGSSPIYEFTENGKWYSVKNCGGNLIIETEKSFEEYIARQHKYNQEGN